MTDIDTSKTPPAPDLAFDPWRDGEPVQYDVMKQLRERCPVSPGPYGMYYLARHDDVDSVFRDSEGFPSQGGMREPGVSLLPEEQLINERDGLHHQRLRRLMQSALKMRQIRATAPYIEQLARELTGDLLEKGGGDVVAGLTMVLPSKVIAHLLGVPEADHEQFKAWSDEVVSSTWPMTNATAAGEGFAASFPDFTAYIDGLLQERRSSANPPDDFITRLVNARDENGEPLADLEMWLTTAHLLYAGNETTQNLIGNLLYELVSKPDLYQRIRDDRSLLPQAIEESLRHDPPVTMLTRTVADPVCLRGVDIAEGERIVVGISSANRDESVFAEPDVFDIDRPDISRHLAFGKGAHLCLGNELARLEARVTLEVFLTMVERAEFQPGFAYEKIPVWWVNGPTELGLRLYPA
jgi:cytochrome P450